MTDRNCDQFSQFFLSRPVALFILSLGREGEAGAAFRVCGLKVPCLLQVYYLELCLRNTDFGNCVQNTPKHRQMKSHCLSIQISCLPLCFNKGPKGHLNIVKIQVVLGRLIQSNQTAFQKLPISEDKGSVAGNSGHWEPQEQEWGAAAFTVLHRLARAVGGGWGQKGCPIDVFYFIFNRKLIGFEKFSLSPFQAVKLSHGPALHLLHLLFCFAWRSHWSVKLHQQNTNIHLL